MILKIRTASMVLAAIFLIVTFQNCGGPLNQNIDILAGKVKKYADAPFAFKSDIDQITYMSCSKPSAPRAEGASVNTFFTFKVGAYGSSGVKIREDFSLYVNNKHYPIGLNKTNLKDSLVYSERNNGASLQLAVRPRSNIRDVVHSSSGNPTSGMDYVNLWPSLTTDTIVDNFIKAGSDNKINYIVGGRGIGQRRIEGGIVFNTDAGLETDVRAALTNNAYLTLTYSTPEDRASAESDVAARSPSHFGETSSKRVWGQAFQVDFLNLGHVSSPSRVLNSVRQLELDDEDGPKYSEGVSWSCPSSLRLTIVSPLDANDKIDGETTLPGLCPTGDDGSQITSSNESVFRTIRHHLRSEDWYVNLTGLDGNPCIVPKAGKGDICYSRNYPVEYGTGECGPEKTVDCAHFVSICTRND